MRSVSGAFLTEQQAVSNTPYIHLVFTYPDASTVDYSSDQAGRRIQLIDHTEEPFQERATIVLDNYDMSIPNLLGTFTEIGYGYVTNGYVDTARLWVKYQQEVYAPGNRYVILELEGMWTRMTETILRLGNPPLYQQDYSTSTVLEIMQAVAAECAITIDAPVTSDGIIGVYEPTFSVNSQPFEDAASVLRRLLEMTLCYMRPKPTRNFDLVYPQEGDSVDISYYFDQPQQYYSFVERRKLLIPNHIYAYGKKDPALEWSTSNYYSAEVQNASEIALYYDVPSVATFVNVNNQSDLNNRATVMLSRAKAELTAGFMVAPHDARLELYDKISVWLLVT